MFISHTDSHSQQKIPYPHGYSLGQTDSKDKCLINKKELINFACSGYSKKSPLLGDRFSNSIAKGIALLRHVQKTYGIEVPEELLERYQTTLEIAKRCEEEQSNDPDSTSFKKVVAIAEYVCQKVIDLKPGHMMTLPIGYATLKSGHAMLLDIKNRGDGTYNLYIYSTGDGIVYHESILTEDKEIVRIPLKFKSVPKNLLFCLIKRKNNPRPFSFKLYFFQE